MSSGAVKAPGCDPSDKHPRLHIEDLLHTGQGVGRMDGRVVFVTGALPGEEVRVALDEVKASYSVGHAVEIVSPAPERTVSPCDVFPRCGGCQTLHLAYPASVAWKQRVVREALVRLGGLDGVNVRPTQVSPLLDGFRYRNKVSLVVGTVGAGLAVGFYAARTHTMVPIRTCPVVVPAVDEAVRALARLARGEPQVLRGLRHVVIRAGAHRSLVVALCGRLRPADGVVEPLRRALPQMTGLVATWDPPGENVIFGRHVETMWGCGEVTEVVAGVTFRFGITSFFQINTPVLEDIAGQILERLSGCSRILDVYCGVGTFSVLLGLRGASVTGIDSAPRSVDDAARNAARHGVTRVAFLCADAAAALGGRYGRQLVAGADAVLIDPPRRGCDAVVLDAVSGAGVPRIEYLSCNPATLARDARRLVDAGYRLEDVRPFDMFPFTGHVEVLAEFVRGGAAQACV
jgi:23S rRNA (uracil1939-C5)-methyltransferase